MSDVHGHDPETCHPCRRDRAASAAMLREAGGEGPEFWGDRMLREMRERPARLKREWQDAQAALALCGIFLPDREAFWALGAKATFRG